MTGPVGEVSQDFVLDARDIEKRFGPTSVLKKANLRVAPGEIHAFLGGMYDEAATGAAKVLQTRNLVGKVGIATADGSPTTVKLLKEGVIQGLFLQEAGGQGIEGVQQVYNALTGAEVTKDLPLAEPLVTAKDVDNLEAKAKLKRVYPPSAGDY